MSPRSARIILLGILLPVFLLLCLTVEVTPANGLFFTTADQSVLLGLFLLDVLAVMGTIIGIVIGSVALAWLIVCACDAKDEQ